MVDVTVAGGALATQQADTLGVEVFEGQKRLTGAGAQIDSALGGVVAEMLRAGLISGRAGETTVIPGRDTIGAKRLVVHGTGGEAGRTENGVRNRAGNLGRALRTMDARNVVVSTQGATEHLDAEIA